MELRLHKDKGVNPHLTYCPRCGGESNELILVGALDFVTRCACGINLIGGGPCPDCKTRGERVRSIGEHERLPASEPCADCKAELEEHEKAVAEGGVYFKCADCSASGVIKASAPFAAEVRKAHGIDAPAPCGVEFTKNDGCPACGGKEDA